MEMHLEDAMHQSAKEYYVHKNVSGKCQGHSLRIQRDFPVSPKLTAYELCIAFGNTIAVLSSK